ncbi:MAG: hypothetical protein NT169_26505 [Chloroflexi bacterium]|nr:hypothetical protein [Chloroflexota bacterium]
MSRYIPCFRFGLAFLLAGLIFGGLILAGMPAQAGGEGPHRVGSAPLVNPARVDDAAAMNGACADPMTSSRVCAGRVTPRQVARMGGESYTRYFPLWYNDTRKTRP